MSWLLAVLLLLAPTPDSRRANERLKEGQQLMADEKFEEAAQAFRQAIALDPLLTMAHYGLGQASMALKQYPAAVTAFRGAREAFERRTADSVTRSFENENVRERRIRDLEDRIRENSDRLLNPSSAAGRQQVLRIQQWEMELSTLRRPSEQRSTTPTVPPGILVALGSAHFRSGQMPDAEREYRAALALDAKLGEPRNNLAVVLLLTGKPAEARAQLAIAEKNGFKPAEGLRKDIDTALATASKTP